MSDLPESSSIIPVVQQTTYVQGSNKDGGARAEAHVPVEPLSRESSRARCQEQKDANEATHKNEQKEQHNQEALTGAPKVDPVRPML